MPYGINQQSDFAIASSLTPRSRTTTDTGSSTDLSNFFRASVVYAVGIVSNTAETHTLFIQESTDNATFTNVSSASLNPSSGSVTLTSQTAQGVQEFEYLGGSRYLRVLSSVSALASGGVYAAAIIRSQNRATAPQ